jgi:hypothetical protein
MATDYMRALETRLQWLAWAKKEGKEAWNNIEIVKGMMVQKRPGERTFPEELPAYEVCLETGDTFCMNREFCDLVDHARQTVPDDLMFEASWMQSEHGWLWLETPFRVPIPEKDKHHYKDYPDLKQLATVSAIGWAKIPPFVTSSNGRICTEGSYHFLCYQPFSRWNVPGFGCWSHFTVIDGDRLIDRIHQFETNAGIEKGGYKIDRNNDTMHEMRWIYAAFHLMAQKLATTLSNPAPRHTRKRMEREQSQLQPLVKVVTLRRLEQDRKRDALQRLLTPNTVDWQWKWAVRGHWRNQWFPSLEDHRQIFIEAYVKGPEDKPFKMPGHQIFVARR